MEIFLLALIGFQAGEYGTELSIYVGSNPYHTTKTLFSRHLLPPTVLLWVYNGFKLRRWKSSHSPPRGPSGRLRILRDLLYGLPPLLLLLYKESAGCIFSL